MDHRVGSPSLLALETTSLSLLSEPQQPRETQSTTLGAFGTRVVTLWLKDVICTQLPVSTFRWCVAAPVGGACGRQGTCSEHRAQASFLSELPLCPQQPAMSSPLSPPDVRCLHFSFPLCESRRESGGSQWTDVDVSYHSSDLRSHGEFPDAGDSHLRVCVFPNLHSRWLLPMSGSLLALSSPL